jgi:membrane fusion protein (multidrug efflux system)
MRRMCLCLCLLAACQKPAKPPVPPVEVTAMQVEPQTIPADFEYVGVGESSHIVQLRARVEGYLQTINYKEGGLVKTNDLMFVIDQRPFIAAVESARGVLEQKKALLWNATQVKNRMVPLYKENAVSQRDLDNAIADELAAQANVDTANANLYQAELNLSFASLTAPVTGLASQAKYREGALISPGEENLLTTIYVVDPIWVNFSVSDRELLQAKKDIKDGHLIWPANMNFQIEAILSDGTVIPSEGYIDFTNPAIQQSTGTMLMRSILPNPNLLIYPGQFVRVVVKGAIRPNAILVPQTAVVQGETNMFVYVVDGGKARMQPVVPGDWYKDYWIINDGLKAGDIVITQGVNKIQNGSAVTVQTMLPSKVTP